MSDFKKFKCKSPKAEVMLITPDIARRLLSTSPGNRNTRGWYVKLLAAVMRRGEWRVTSQGIGINKHGQLIDAHHRLMACVLCGCSFYSVVVMGLEPGAYEVIDTGMKRTYGDLTMLDKRVAEVLRLGSIIALAETMPTVDQTKPIMSSMLKDCIETLIEYCGTSRKFYSSASVKLAACVTMMDGGDHDYVLDQYRALCNLHFEKMSPAAQALVRQVQDGKAVSARQRDSLARALKVFDVTKKNMGKIQIADDDVSSAIDRVRRVILAAAGISKNGGSL